MFGKSSNFCSTSSDTKYEDITGLWKEVGSVLHAVESKVNIKVELHWNNN
jgi:hypothetical protein